MISFWFASPQDILHSELCLNEAIKWILVVYYSLDVFIMQTGN